jgi:hypothetical protein
LLMQACQVTDGLSNGNGFNVDNLPNDFEVHAHPSEVGWQLQVPAVACRSTARFSCGPTSVTLGIHISARRGRQLQPVLGNGQGHPPPDASAAYHGAMWPTPPRQPTNLMDYSNRSECLPVRSKMIVSAFSLYLVFAQTGPVSIR